MDKILSFLSFEILVSPETIFATVSPNLDSISSIVYFESSTTSCKSAEAIPIESSPIFSAAIFATARG